MMDINELCKFLVKAKKGTYAAWEYAIKIKENDKSETLVLEEWNWKYHDNYFWGEPFGWREVVFYEWNPVYIMTYYGWVNEIISNFGEVYKTLQQALSNIPENKPYRWPEKYILWEYEYINTYHWEVDNFYGEEIIKYKGKEVYKARYSWWLVDQRK